jgi:hypothetical protein
LGYDLNGDVLKIGIWEVGGIPELMHPEFLNATQESRIVVKDTAEVEETSHATHVAGTLIAKGESDIKYEGMASNALLDAYDAENDIEEIIETLQNEMILVSNHSYGVPISNLEGNEWYMGAYTAYAANFDLITNWFPYYLPVMAGGNDGNTVYEGGIQPGYDKMTGNTNSKNALVVANASRVETERRSGAFLSAEINTGSSQGPTDDGRIKPDISGLGTSIESADLEGGYRSATGTSMASPNVAGSALLLQELNQRLTGNYLRSSTLKGLISVTADDAGAVGPDPFFGWGVMNSKRAAEALINNGEGDYIEERTLNQGESHFLRFENSSNSTMKVAIAWNDPAGRPKNDTLRNVRTPILVNDLDIKVKNTFDKNEVYQPWLLDLDNLSSPAIQGDNIVDNIEIIEIDNQGLFDIEISHKGNLRNNDENAEESNITQAYSLIVLNGDFDSVFLSNDDFSTNSVSFWPNPTKNQLHISSREISFSQNTTVSVYDMVGRQVITENNFTNGKRLSLDLSSLSKGVYIVDLKDGRHSIQKRIIKE